MLEPAFMTKRPLAKRIDLHRRARRATPVDRWLPFRRRTPASSGRVLLRGLHAHQLGCLTCGSIRRSTTVRAPQSLRLSVPVHPRSPGPDQRAPPHPCTARALIMTILNCFPPSGQCRCQIDFGISALRLGSLVRTASPANSCFFFMVTCTVHGINTSPFVICKL